MVNHINEKIKTNAILSYIMPIINIMFLFNKDNEYINHKLVKSHTKVAVFLHIITIVSYLTLISFWLVSNIDLWIISLNNLILDIILLFVVLIIFRWMNLAYKWEEYNFLNFINSKKLISIENNEEVKVKEEKEKLNIILSYIPFVWYIVWSKNNWNYYEDILKVNLFVTVLILIIAIFWLYNLLSLFLLAYIIFISYVWINLFIKDELLEIKLPYYFLPKWKIKLQKNLLEYIYNYIKWDFKSFESIKNKNEKLEQEEKQKSADQLEKLEIFKRKNLIYIPFVNFFLLKAINSKSRFHMQNSIMITIILVLITNAVIFNILNPVFYITVLFPICFGIWKISEDNYKMPYISQMYRLLIKLVKLLSFGYKDIKRRKNEVKITSYKIKD